MCKFHILGMCSKGSGCKFAHDKSELNALPDLSRTKLCKTLISTGSCEDPNCQYAHNREELRAMPDGSQALLDDLTTRVHRQAAEGREGNPQPATDQVALQQMLSSMQTAAMQWAQQQAQQQALQSTVVPQAVPLAQGVAAASTPAGPPGPWPSSLLNQALSPWPQQQAMWPTIGQSSGQSPHAESKVVSLCEGLSFKEGQSNAAAAAHVLVEPARHVPTAEASQVYTQSQNEPNPRLVVKNTFIDLESAMPKQTTCPRSSTWGAGLSALVRSDSEDSMSQLQDAEAQSQQSTMSGKQTTPGSLSCVPERRRIFGGLRQFSEESETSTGTPPATEKRLQDTPYSDGCSQESLSTLDEDEAEREQPEARAGPAEEAHFDFKIKNTFIELDEEESPTARPLRTVQTAMGRLDTMG